MSNKYKHVVWLRFMCARSEDNKWDNHVTTSSSVFVTFRRYIDFTTSIGRTELVMYMRLSVTWTVETNQFTVVLGKTTHYTSANGIRHIKQRYLMHLTHGWWKCTSRTNEQRRLQDWIETLNKCWIKLTGSKRVVCEIALKFESG